MIDPRVEAAAKAIATETDMPYLSPPTYPANAAFVERVLAAADAADREAGVRRITRDDATRELLTTALFRWHIRGYDRDAYRALADEVLDVLAPVGDYWCDACNHNHAGPRLGGICVGCPCIRVVLEPAGA